MSLGLMLYLASVSDKLVQITGGLAPAFLFAIVPVSIWHITAKYEQSEQKRRFEIENTYGQAPDLIRAKANLDGARDAVDLSSAWLKRITVSAISVLFLSIVVPSSKDLYIIYGAGVAEDIVKNPKVQETGGKILEVINKKLEEMVDIKKDK